MVDMSHKYAIYQTPEFIRTPVGQKRRGPLFEGVDASIQVKMILCLHKTPESVHPQNT